MGSEYKLFWTAESIQNLESILDYLSSEWGEKEVSQFRKMLSRQISLIQKFPLIFPASDISPRLRKAVLSKQTIVFYEIKEQFIYIVYLFNTFQNPEKIK